MSIFWVIALLMVAVGLALLLPALLGKKNASAEDNREQNIAIARERMNELEKELATGVLTQETYRQTLDELEKGLLIDVSAESSEPGTSLQKSGKAVLAALLILVPLLSFGLYEILGSPQYLDVAGPGKPATALAAKGKAGEIPSMEEMISGLQQKTAENPDDPNGWYLLGRLYAATDRFTDSVAAYEKLVEVSERQPTALVVLADSLAMLQGGSLAGRPIELVQEALQKEPQHTTALWMAGQAAANEKQYLQAIDYWQRASLGMKENVEMQAELRKMIAEAVNLAEQAGMDVADISLPEVSAGTSVSVEVTIDPTLLSQIKESDVLFIFARAVSGPPMPLAAIKRQARELPVSIILDDSSLLRPGTHLSDYKQLKLGARVSHSGQPVAQSGDLQSAVQVITPGSKDVILLHIDQLVP